MDQYVDGHPPYWIKGIQDPQGIRRGEPKYVFALANDHECLQTTQVSPLVSHCEMRFLQRSLTRANLLESSLGNV